MYFYEIKTRVLSQVEKGINSFLRNEIMISAYLLELEFSLPLLLFEHMKQPHTCMCI